VTGLRCPAVAALLLSAGGAQSDSALETIRRLRLWGDLDSARLHAERAIRVDSADATRRVLLRLELARIHDRIGLHYNRRPVAAALQLVDAAAQVRPLTPGAAAAVLLARAELLYRAEARSALEPARAAVAAFQALGDRHGEAEAIHLIGLVHLQADDLPAARASFERSLALDRAAGERPFFRGEYERHVAFVKLREGDTTGAVPHLARSLALRREVRARDASLFAANTLAATLLDLGRLEEAWNTLRYAMTVAASLDSPFGQAQLALIAGRYHALGGDAAAARISFSTAARLAASIGAEGIVQQAGSRLRQLPAR
jgi:tetratricopeptide (TPR) repeat protein